jgi:hypothetical protein
MQVRNKTLELALLRQMKKAKSLLGAFVRKIHAKRPPDFYEKLLQKETDMGIFEISFQNHHHPSNHNSRRGSDAASSKLQKSKSNLSADGSTPHSPISEKLPDGAAPTQLSLSVTIVEKQYPIGRISAQHEEELSKAGVLPSVVDPADETAAPTQASKTISFYRSSKQGYWVLQPVWVPSDGGRDHPPVDVLRPPTGDDESNPDVMVAQC